MATQLYVMTNPMGGNSYVDMNTGQYIYDAAGKMAGPEVDAKVAAMTKSGEAQVVQPPPFWNNAQRLSTRPVQRGGESTRDYRARLANWTTAYNKDKAAAQKATNDYNAARDSAEKNGRAAAAARAASSPQIIGRGGSNTGMPAVDGFKLNPTADMSKLGIQPNAFSPKLNDVVPPPEANPNPQAEAGTGDWTKFWTDAVQKGADFVKRQQGDSNVQTQINALNQQQSNYDRSIAEANENIRRAESESRRDPNELAGQWTEAQARGAANLAAQQQDNKSAGGAVFARGEAAQQARSQHAGENLQRAQQRRDTYEGQISQRQGEREMLEGQKTAAEREKANVREDASERERRNKGIGDVQDKGDANAGAGATQSTPYGTTRTNLGSAPAAGVAQPPSENTGKGNDHSALDQEVNAAIADGNKFTPDQQKEIHAWVNKQKMTQPHHYENNIRNILNVYENSPQQLLAYIRTGK